MQIHLNQSRNNFYYKLELMNELIFFLLMEKTKLHINK